MSIELLGIVLTRACNLRCEYCNVARASRTFVKWNSVRDSLDGLLCSPSRETRITFTGGEPLLAFATIKRAVSYVESRIGEQRVRWRVLTNGLLLDADAIRFFDDHRFYVNVSSDGVRSAQRLRGPGVFERLDDLIDRIRSASADLFTERLTVSLTLSPSTLPYLHDSVEYFLDKGVKAFGVSAVKGNVRWDLRRIDEAEHCFEQIRCTLLHHYERTRAVPFLLFRRSASADHDGQESGCGVHQGRCAVLDPDGHLYACLAGTPTYQPSPVPSMQAAVTALDLGRANAPDFEARVARMKSAAIASEMFTHPERRYSSYRRCADCEFLGRCHICPLASASVPGWHDPYRVSDFLCAFNQVALAARDRFPAQPTADDYFRGLVPLSALRLGAPPSSVPEP